MFLKKLYCYNKALFLVFIFFILSFLFINYKWGMASSPIYLFGMFSGPIHLSEPQHLLVLSVNDRKVDMSKYSFAKKDMMLVIPEKYLKSKEQNLQVYQLMNRFFSPLGLGSLHDPYNYMNRIDDAGFKKWYMHYLAFVLDQPVNTFELSSQTYIWENNHIQALGLLQKLPFTSTK